MTKIPAKKGLNLSHGKGTKASYQKPPSKNHVIFFFFFKRKKRKEKCNHILLLESQDALLGVLETPELGFKNEK